MAASISYEDRANANEYLDSSISFSMCGKYKEAINAVRKSIEIYPDFAQAHNKLGDYLIKLGKIEEAAQAYEKSLELNPDNENSNFDMGCTLAHLGQFDKSIEYLNRALAMKPDHTEIYAHLGRVYLMAGDTEKAIVHLERAVAANPADPMANYTLACTLYQLGQQDRAVDLFQNVIGKYTSLTEKKERFAEGHYYIGYSFFVLGKLDKALEHMLKAIEYDTDAIDYHYSFGMLYSDADAFCALSQIQAALGKTTDASESMQKALKLEPDNPRFLQIKSQLGI